MSGLIRLGLVMVVFGFCGCSEKKTDAEIIEFSEVLLSNFQSGNLAAVYECRDENFKHDVPYKVFEKSIKQATEVEILNNFKFSEVVVDNGIYVVKFRYSFIVNDQESSMSDYMVLRISNKKIECLDIGMRLFFSLNSPIEWQNKTY